MSIKIKPLRLADDAYRVLSADLLLFEPATKNVISDGIEFTGRSRFTHAAKASWMADELWCLEARELAGCRAVTLASQVKKFPGRIHAFRANATGLPECSHGEASLRHLEPGFFYDRAAADRLAHELTGREYGYLQILRTAAVHSPVLFLARIAAKWLPCLWPVAKWLAKLTPDVTDDELDDGRLVYCSAFCVVVDRVGGGVDPVSDLSDAYTEPGDCARSWFYRGPGDSGYIGTFVE